MKVLRATAVIALLLGPAYAQAPQVNLIPDTPSKTPEEREADQARDKAYKESLKKIPDAENSVRPLGHGAIRSAQGRGQGSRQAANQDRQHPELERFGGQVLAQDPRVSFICGREPIEQSRDTLARAAIARGSVWRSRGRSIPLAQDRIGHAKRYIEPVVFCVGVCDMAQRPRDLANRMARRRKADDGYLRETFTLPREMARTRARDFLVRYPKAAYMSAVESWRELPGGDIEFTMRRLRSADSPADAQQRSDLAARDLGYERVDLVARRSFHDRPKALRRQAEYVRLAAQAWSPSDAITKVELKSHGDEKGSNRDRGAARRKWVRKPAAYGWHMNLSRGRRTQ